MAGTLSSNWFNEFFPTINWEVAEIGLKFYARSPDLIPSYGTTFSIIEEMENLPANPEWVPCTNQPVAVSTVTSSPVFRFSKNVDGDVTTFKLVYEQSPTDLLATVEDFTGWEIDSYSQEQLSSVIFYIKDYAADPDLIGKILFATNQGIGRESVIHKGALYGQTSTPAPSGGVYAVKVSQFGGVGSSAQRTDVAAGFLTLVASEPRWESSHAQHLWIEPQRTNFVANPSFEGPLVADKPFGWRTNDAAQLSKVLGGRGPGIYCGKLDIDAGEPAIIESNYFPVVGNWASVSFLIRSSVDATVTYGIVGFDGAYQFPIMPSTLSSTLTATPLGVGEEAASTGFYTITGLFQVPDGSVDLCLRIKVTSDADEAWNVWIDNVLVDPHEGQYTYFDGNSTEGLPGDFRWMGGSAYADQHFSMWYNNYQLAKTRLMGGYDANDEAYKPGMVEEWAPTGANIVAHWDAVTAYTPRNWEGNAFYPISDVSQAGVTIFLETS
jgi:hypothetical protein